MSIFDFKTCAVDGFATSLLAHYSVCSIRIGRRNRLTVRSMKEKTLYLSNKVNKVQ